jgi:hypothetical protein
MQTFLPYLDFSLCASILDKKRLNKQITEANQILALITGKTQNRWKNHTAVRMWLGYDACLRSYINSMVRQWHSYGFGSHSFVDDPSIVIKPPWLENPIVIQSHRNSLLNKDFAHYSKFGWDYIKDAPKRCYWPVKPKSREVQNSNAEWEKLYNERLFCVL